MALQVWLPLNGNLDNQGLSSVVVSNSGATVDDAGKIGKCYSFDGSSNECTICDTDVAGLAGSTQFSTTMWLCPTTANKVTAAFEVAYNTYFQIDFVNASLELRDNSTGPTGTRKSYPMGNFTANVWTHLAITYNSGTVSIYRDGELYSTQTTGGSYLNTQINRYKLGRAYNQNYWYPGKINDVRIYDHCLSPKEVKEISKALVLHYKLNKPNANLISGSVVRMSENGETPAREYLAICSPQGQFDQYGLVPYTISFDIKSAVSGTFNIYGSPGTGFKYCFTAKNFNVTTEWQRFSYTFTPYVANPTGSWSSISIYGTYNTGKIPSVRRVKLELGTKETPLIDDTSYAADCSGYKNGGIVFGRITGSVDSTDSPRFSTSTRFTPNSYINAGKGGKVLDAISVCCWASMSNWNSYNARLLSCTEAGGWNFEPSSGKMNFACGTGTGSNVYKSITSTTKLSELAAGWHQFIGTYDGFKTKIYIDGVLEGTLNAYSTKTPLKYNANNVVFIGAEAGSSDTTPAGQYFSGSISDVRIYATALSEEDIKELYETAAITDDGGVFGCYEFQETGSLQLDNTGLFKIKEIKEHETLNDAAIYSDKLLANRLIEI